ncbi:MAG: hypothetical protein EX269_14965 [Acidimicrobiales bacterium]|nr:MAG: hypothetical protein EX269_14965 [Acidimicrobiales bacterium]
MTSTDAWIGSALRRVRNAVTIVELHGDRSVELGELTQFNLSDTIQQALGHGFSMEAVAEAAAMTVEQVAAIADGSAAA